MNNNTKILHILQYINKILVLIIISIYPFHIIYYILIIFENLILKKKKSLKINIIYIYIKTSIKKKQVYNTFNYFLYLTLNIILMI